MVSGIMKKDSSDTLKRKIMDTNVANEVAVKFLENAFTDNHVDSIEDERYRHVITRKQSRFSNQLTPNEILSLEFHPSGHTVAYSRMDGSLTIWPFISATFIPGKMIHIKDACGNDKLVTSVSWNPLEITQLITASNSNEVNIWEYDEEKRTASKIKNITVSQRAKIIKAQFDPHGQYLLAMTKSESMYLYSVKNEFQLVTTVSISKFIGDDSVYSTSWDNSGENIIIGTKTGKIKVLTIDTSTNTITNRLQVQGHRSSVTCLKMDPLGRYLISGGADGSCNIWELNTFICTNEIAELNSGIISIDMCHMGKILGVCMADNRTCFFDITTGKILYETTRKDLNSEPIIKFFPDRTMFLLSGKNDTLQKHYFGSGMMNLLSIWDFDGHRHKEQRASGKISGRRRERKAGSDKPPSRLSRSQRNKRFQGNISKRR